jgi:hypothetical protein
MIKFIHQELHVKSILSDSENYVHNISNKKLAEKLNERFGDKVCPDHPHFENTFLVDLSKNDDFLTLQSWCCDKFKPTLDLIAQNKDPYSVK